MSPTGSETISECSDVGDTGGATLGVARTSDELQTRWTSRVVRRGRTTTATSTMCCVLCRRGSRCSCSEKEAICSSQIAASPVLLSGLEVRSSTSRSIDDGTVVAGGAAPLPRVARTAAEAGRCGLEFYAGIPGTVGGAVMMNAGGHGSDTAERLISAVVVNRTTGKRSTRTAADLALSYRHSNLGPDDLVTSARFSTSPCTRADAEARIREITRWRKQHQPGGTFNAGSVFKNPPGDAAGRLIDAAGLKGLPVRGSRRVGNARQLLHRRRRCCCTRRLGSRMGRAEACVRVHGSVPDTRDPICRCIRGEWRGTDGTGDGRMNTMDHRIAERRHEVTEERARGRLRWLIWLVLLVVVVAAAIWFVNSPILSIRTVTVTGAERTDPAAIADGLGVRPGTPTISVKGGAIEAALLESPWVADVNVTVSWPGSVEIDVRERVPRRIDLHRSWCLRRRARWRAGRAHRRWSDSADRPLGSSRSITRRRPDQPCRHPRRRRVRGRPVARPPALDHGDGVGRHGRCARRSVHRRCSGDRLTWHSRPPPLRRSSRPDSRPEAAST